LPDARRRKAQRRDTTQQRVAGLCVENDDVWTLRESSATFFTGFSPVVFGVVAANGSVGLVITAVYRYADVVVKTFGLAGSSVTPFLLERVGFIPSTSQQKGAAGGGGSGMTLGNLMGAVLIFYAAYVYVLPNEVVNAASVFRREQRQLQDAPSPTAAALGGAAAAGVGDETPGVVQEQLRTCNRYMGLLFTGIVTVVVLGIIMPC